MKTRWLSLYFSSRSKALWFAKSSNCTSQVNKNIAFQIEESAGTQRKAGGKKAKTNNSKYGSVCDWSTVTDD